MIGNGDEHGQIGTQGLITEFISAQNAIEIRFSFSVVINTFLSHALRRGRKFYA